MATKNNPERSGSSLNCEAWEAMLADALDGTLEARDSAAFTAHAAGCSMCGELLEEARRGTEWLRFLRETPEAPEGLLEKILAGTTGISDIQQPLPVAGMAAMPQQPWMNVPVALLERHMAHSRLLMTLAMAFFSVALTLNLTGVKLNQVKLSDLKPSTLATSVSHQYFTTSSHLVRYYSNLRIVYELESRLNDVRRDDVRRDTDQQPAATPGPPPESQKSAPAAQPTPQSATRPGGSAHRGGFLTAPARRTRTSEAAPVLARVAPPVGVTGLLARAAMVVSHPSFARMGHPASVVISHPFDRLRAGSSFARIGHPLCSLGRGGGQVSPLRQSRFARLAPVEMTDGVMPPPTGFAPAELHMPLERSLG